MVIFFRSRPQPTAATLAAAIAGGLHYTRNQIRQKQVLVDVDVEPAVAATICNSRFCTAVHQLLDLAVSRCPLSGDLYISACQTERGLELEIADSGTQASDRRTNAFTRSRAEDLAARLSDAAPESRWGAGVAVYCTRCPQGGLAWTIVLQPQQTTPAVALTATADE